MKGWIERAFTYSFHKYFYSVSVVSADVRREYLQEAYRLEKEYSLAEK